MSFSIGILSKRSTVKVATIRYYEQIGLLRGPSRTDGRQRRYCEADFARLQFVRHARNLGFGIEEIRELLGLEGSASPGDRELAERHLEAIDGRIRALQILHAELSHALARPSWEGLRLVDLPIATVTRTEDGDPNERD